MNMPSILSLVVAGLLVAPVHAATAPSEPFQPPAESSLPDNAFGEMVRQGQALFVETRKNAPHLVGNQLNCVNCHLDQGRRANSAPQWAAYPVYPAFRAKNNKVNTFAERLQGCFQFSMNGKVPAADSPEIKALTVYAYWLASQAPTGVSLPGRGYPDVAPPEGGYSIERGAKVYAAQCAICHGADGQGQMALGQTVFPPLWGAQSFNWGAGMHRINTAASFIKYNMPLGKPGTLSNRDAWDVAAFMNSHERPQDPRLVEGSVEKTRQKFHANDGVNLYGQKVNGVLLGQGI
ncbi:c-type cytochrome [Pseudomonas aeruginosa]|uniref:c-type cytochrome n=1 Tax=Pseudomonas aeruginosa TaxID=287 RepID=UPI0003D2134B|nr:c-type cytochrome [Pseudomonas aeruginosa]AHB55787.1 cytochrome C [Pseudomonas aeruginosa MTB-1]ELM3797388.1 c-type cytochrome [Pseudomonas aeruginosa]MCV0089012.1 c-type cytochrome [Pseudomonas aeruginosa]HEP9536662.1 c-type cytochrome [Pseudomonas aeruginosa]